jgi:hypothetical protein
MQGFSMVGSQTRGKELAKTDPCIKENSNTTLNPLKLNIIKPEKKNTIYSI